MIGRGKGYMVENTRWGLMALKVLPAVIRKWNPASSIILVMLSATCQGGGQTGNEWCISRLQRESGEPR